MMGSEPHFLGNFYILYRVIHKQAFLCLAMDSLQQQAEDRRIRLDEFDLSGYYDIFKDVENLELVFDQVEFFCRPVGKAIKTIAGCF